MYYVGSPNLFDEILPNGIPTTSKSNQYSELQNQGKTVMVAGTSTEILALLAVADEMRENSNDVIQKLHSLGIQKTIMLTGDNKGTANAIGKQVGVSDIQADLLPQDKLAFIKELRGKYDVWRWLGMVSMMHQL